MKRVLKCLLLVIAGGMILALSAAVTYGILAEGRQIVQPIKEGVQRMWPISKENPDLAESEEDSAFQEVAYYRDFYEDRYKDCQARYTQWSHEEVVRWVNMGLDKPFYEGAECIEDVEALPLLVNKYHYLPEDYTPKDMVYWQSGEQLGTAAASAFLRLQSGAREVGHQIDITTAYRSISRQESLYQTLVAQGSVETADKQAARPGYSEHHTGNALDIYAINEEGSFAQTAAYRWLADNSWQYGYIIRYPQGKEEITGYQFEPWHITYVGEETAQIMHEQGIETLEEYVATRVQDDNNEPQTVEEDGDWKSRLRNRVRGWVDFGREKTTNG